MAFGLFVLVLGFSFAVSCPPTLSLDNHCECSVETDRKTAARNIIVECTDVHDPVDLKFSIREFRGLNIHKLKILNSNLSYVPHNLFRGVTVEHLYFGLSTIRSFSDTDVAFRGLRDSLIELEIANTGGLDSFDWSLLRKLRQLRSVRIAWTDLRAIRGVSADESRLNIQEVVIYHSELTKLGYDAFASFDGLEYISLSEGKLREVKRSMLPNPANQLYMIKLSDNHLMTLPEDFFTNMPKLGSVILNYNYLTTLKEETFEPIWHQLDEFAATGNRLICDCRAKWILEKPRRWNMRIYVNCYEPAEVQWEPITTLPLSYFQC